MIRYPARDLVDRYEAHFGRCPVGPGHSLAQIEHAEGEMRRALKGARGFIPPEDYPLDLPDDADP